MPKFTIFEYHDYVSVWEVEAQDKDDAIETYTEKGSHLRDEDDTMDELDVLDEREMGHLC